MQVAWSGGGGGAGGGALLCLPGAAQLLGQHLSSAAAAAGGSVMGLLRGQQQQQASGSSSAAACVSTSAAAASPPPAEAKPAAAEARPTVTVTVNGRAVHVPANSSLYDAVQKAGAFVPVLCKHPRLPNTPGACRVCMVEVDGRLKPACCTPVHDGAQVATDTPTAVDAVTGTLSLLRANHPEDCMSCDANGRCEFQDLITRYQVPKWPKLKEVSEDYIEHTAHTSLYDQSSPAIHLDLEKCIKCARCVTTCEEVQGMNVLGMFHRGRERHIGFYYESDLELSKCIECGQCVSVCPVGALYEKTEWREVLELLQSKRKVMVVQTAPSTRVAIGEEFGLAPGTVSTGQMVAGLKQLGFDYVFDTDFAADLTIMEEGTELLQRLKQAWGLAPPPADGSPPPPLPMFTSCCPAWVNLVERDFPQLIPHLSSCKSPQQMLGPVVKALWAKKAGIDPKDIVSVAIMPCTAKKHEANRPEMGRDGYRDVDYVLTTRELGRLFRFNKISVAGLPSAPYDHPMGTGTGAAVLFGNTGGVMEAAVRTVYEVVTGKPLPNHLQLDATRGLKGIKEAALEMEVAPGVKKTVRIAVASGIANARALVEDIRNGRVDPPFDFVEVMSCPGGCIGGGGQPKTKGHDVLQRRMQAVYALDADAPLRQSHENPEIKEAYKTYLGEPGSHTAHELLHTRYTDRSRHTEQGYSDAAKEDAEKHLPEEVRRARESGEMPGPPGEKWSFQPLFRPEGYRPPGQPRPRRQLP